MTFKCLREPKNSGNHGSHEGSKLWLGLGSHWLLMGGKGRQLKTESRSLGCMVPTVFCYGALITVNINRPLYVTSVPPLTGTKSVSQLRAVLVLCHLRNFIPLRSSPKNSLGKQPSNSWEWHNGDLRGKVYLIPGYI
jgi:hypothetical protein